MPSQKSETAFFVIPTRLCQGFGGEESCFYRQVKDPSLLVGMTSLAFCETSHLSTVVNLQQKCVAFLPHVHPLISPHILRIA
jgi:hypothetical protein